MATTYKFVNNGINPNIPASVNKIVDGKIVVCMPRANDTREWYEYQDWLTAGNTTEASD